MANRRARELRKNPTEAEKFLWRRIRGRQLRGARFRRQHPIGPYVVDFFCPQAKLVIEIDGGQHAIDGERDGGRTAWLEERGYLVVRFWNNDVLGNIDGVLHRISEALASR